MTTTAFIGHAGTGKTTSLMSEMEALLSTINLEPGQKILAITRMNGARHRLHDRLAKASIRISYDCKTIDSLAWTLVSRWRTKARELSLGEVMEVDFDGTCAIAAELLKDKEVLRWLTSSYPIVLVDEFQDCKSSRFEIIKALSGTCHLCLAADGFQDLSGSMNNPCMDWLKTSATINELSIVHRTDKTGLLNAALSVRTEQNLQKGYTKNGFSLVPVKNANVAAKLIAQRIAWSKGEEVVILSPTSPSGSIFVKETLERLREKPFTDKKRTIGPYSVNWELTTTEAVEALFQKIKESSGQNDSHQLPVAGYQEFLKWKEKLKQTQGKEILSDDELRIAIQRVIQKHRSHTRPSKRLRAMTIHQAKNQEFDKVIVLWPVQVRAEPENLRRLLYNGITRAQKDALILVQEPGGSRISLPPFSKKQEVVKKEIPKKEELQLSLLI